MATDCTVTLKKIRQDPSLNVSRQTISRFLHEEFESLKMKQAKASSHRGAYFPDVNGWQIVRIALNASSAMKSGGADGPDGIPCYWPKRE